MRPPKVAVVFDRKHGARIQNVAKMLGHASVSMTLKRYGEILEHDVIEDFERLSGEI